jgi:uncharacterized membrane protein YcjF (UPF0283 family)
MVRSLVVILVVVVVVAVMLVVAVVIFTLTRLHADRHMRTSRRTGRHATRSSATTSAKRFLRGTDAPCGWRSFSTSVSDATAVPTAQLARVSAVCVVYAWLY